MILDTFIFYVILPVITFSLLVIMRAIVKSKNLPDKVVGLDLIGTTLIGFIGAFAILYDEVIFIDLVIILSLVAFFGSVAFAYYLNKGDKK